MWRMWTKSAQSRSAWACSGDCGLIHTTSRPVVGMPGQDALARTGEAAEVARRGPRQRVRGDEGLVDLGHPEQGAVGDRHGELVRPGTLLSHHVTRSTPGRASSSGARSAA